MSTAGWMDYSLVRWLCSTSDSLGLNHQPDMQLGKWKMDGDGKPDYRITDHVSWRFVTICSCLRGIQQSFWPASGAASAGSHRFLRPMCCISRLCAACNKHWHQVGSGVVRPAKCQVFFCSATICMAWTGAVRICPAWWSSSSMQHIFLPASAGIQVQFWNVMKPISPKCFKPAPRIVGGRGLGLACQQQVNLFRYFTVGACSTITNFLAHDTAHSEGFPHLPTLPGCFECSAGFAAGPFDPPVLCTRNQ